MATQKLLSVLFAALFLSLTLVSAAISFTDSNTALTITASDASKAFTVTTNDLANFTHTNNGNFTVTPATANNVNTTTFTVTPVGSIPLGSNSYTFSITAKNATNIADSISKTITVTLTNTTNILCSGSNAADIVIDDIEFDVTSGFGDEDDMFFYALDDVEVTFNVENAGSWDVKNIEINACLFDNKKGKCIMDEGDMDITNDNLDLESNDDDDVTLNFKIDPDQLNLDTTDYTLYLSANGEIDDNDADSNDGSDSCTSGSEDMEIRTDDSFAITDVVSYTENVSCGDLFEISVDVWNTGDEDFANDEIYLQLYSKELGINKEFSFDSGIDGMEKENVVYTVRLPENLSQKTYKLQLSVLDEDNEVMQNTEDDESTRIISVNAGTCILPPQASINASLSDDTPKATVGGEVVIKTIVKNTGTTSATYSVSVSGIDGFATVSEIDPATITLSPGASKEVSIYLTINSDVDVNSKEFTIKATSGTSVSEQRFKLPIQEGFSSNALVNHFKNNWYIYAIVLVNLILIIAIIIAVKSIVRKN